MSPAPLGAAFDLLAAYEPPDGFFFEHEGLGVACSGVAEQVPAGQAVSRLRAHAPGTRAVGALPFAGEGTLLIHPRQVVRVAPGPTSLLGADDAPPRFLPLAVGAPARAFADPQIDAHPSADLYAEAVAQAVALIRGGEARKVVLARTIEVEAGRTLDLRRLAQRLRAVDPHAYTFAASTNEGVFVGASPELLVARRGAVVRANPLAGSAPRAGDPHEDRANAEQLLASAKDREEHRIVVEAIAEHLQPLCDELRWDPEPRLRETPNVWHLSTAFEGVLREPAPDALALALRLHPTPAVGGSPTDVACAAIDRLEPFDRGPYAGPVGWVDAAGDGEWAIALRCALLSDERATLFAGAGIVAGSDPDAEVEETERKFRAFLDALRWG